MAAYIHPAFPHGAITPAALAFFDAFYRTSDTPELHEAYADSFLPDAFFVLGTKQTVGREDILAARKGMWTSVVARHHVVDNIYRFGEGDGDFMLHGTVEHKTKTGDTAQREWWARATLKQDGPDGALKFAYYQVHV